MRVLLVDSTNNFLRNYAVVPSLDVNGNPNGGVTGFLKSLSSFVRKIKPEHVILAWDGQGGSQKRKKIIPEYKNKRKPPRLNRNYDFEHINQEENKIQQRVRLSEYLQYLPVSEICFDHIEADDVIAYLCRHYEDDSKIIVSSDKDFFQLLDTRTIIFSPVKKIFVTSKNVYDKFAIHPKNFAIARAIVGDTSDNLKGVKGIGMKNVVKYFPFLSEKNKVEMKDLFRYCNISGSKYNRFLDAKEIIEKNYQVMQLEDTMLSAATVSRVKNIAAKKNPFNPTMFRVNLMKDGIANFENYFLEPFKKLSLRRNKSGA